MRRLYFSYLLLLLAPFCFSSDFDTKEKLLASPHSSCRLVFFSNDVPGEHDCSECLSEIEQLDSQQEKDELKVQLEQKKCVQKNRVQLEKEKSGWAVYLDQDVLTLDSWTGLNDDRNYTMGLGGSLQGAKYSKGYLATARNFMDDILGAYSNTALPEQYFHALDFGVTAFTPNELEKVDPIIGDRPYASLLYVSNSKLVPYNNHTAIRTNIVLGVLGLDIAKAVQRYLHNQVGISNQDPLGWDNQISEGGELTALYSYERIFSYKKTRFVDLAYVSGVNTGYYTDAYVGGDIRIGKVISPYYSFNANPMSPYNHTGIKTEGKKDNYGFISYKIRVVAYNALLQGQFRHSEVTISTSDVERVLHEVGVGWAYSINENWKLTYSLNYKSKEYKGVESRDHWFGGLYLSKNY